MARVTFDNSKHSKKRPVLILDDNMFVIEGVRITTHKPRKNYIAEYPIVKWKESGLLKPSTIRLTKLVELRKRDFCYYLGMLQEEDIKNIKEEVTKLFDI